MTVEPARFKNAWDEADRLRLLRIPQVTRIYERHPGRRARTRIRPLLLAEQRYVEDTASPLEDSWKFHAHRAAFEKDRNRDTDHLVANYRTIRVTHRRLSYEPERLAAQIRALLGAR
jgi:hypothetical protein